MIYLTMNIKLCVIVFAGTVWFSIPNKAIGQANQSSSDVSKYIKQGIQFENNDDYSSAIYAYTKAIELDPNSAIAYDKRGVAFTKLLKFQKALKDFNHAIGLDRNNHELYNHRGVLFYCIQKTDKALDDYNTALSIFPGYAKAYYNRGIVKLFLDDEKGAMADITKAADLNFQDAIEFLATDLCASN